MTPHRNKLPKGKVSAIELMRVTTSDKLESMHPHIKCKKCGKEQWLREQLPLTWSCFGCGNLVYIELGRPIQQIEILMNSVRKNEFRKTERGTVVPC